MARDPCAPIAIGNALLGACSPVPRSLRHAHRSRVRLRAFSCVGSHVSRRPVPRSPMPPLICGTLDHDKLACNTLIDAPSPRSCPISGPDLIWETIICPCSCPDLRFPFASFSECALFRVRSFLRFWGDLRSRSPHHNGCLSGSAAGLSNLAPLHPTQLSRPVLRWPGMNLQAECAAGRGRDPSTRAGKGADPISAVLVISDL